MPIVAFILLIMSPSFTVREASLNSFLIIWNIRQGQWLTLVDSSYCHHFDIGGSNAPIAKIKTLCGTKQNTLWLTHNDKSHWRNISRFNLKTCLAYFSGSKVPQIHKLTNCPVMSKKIQVIKIGKFEAVFLIDKKFLITGDTPQSRLPRVHYKIGLAPQGGNSQYIKRKNAKLWICQPQHRNKKQLRGCLSTSSFGNIAIQI